MGFKAIYSVSNWSRVLLLAHKPVDAVMKVSEVSVSGLGRCEVDLQDLQHLYLGHVAVEATLLGLVLGATLSVSLGLFTVALCHYLGVARLMLALSSTEPSSYTWMYPAFAKAIYPEPREATGKIVCANCHLSVQP